MQSCESSRREAKLLRLEKGDLDHVCDFYPTYQYDSVIECSDSLLHILYKCGACDKDFSTICALHNHLQDHVAGGSYHYDHVCRTAFPKFDTCCVYTQTELIIHESRNSQEAIDNQDLDITADKSAKKRGRPKGSKNLVKRRKLNSPLDVQIIIEECSDQLATGDILTQDTKTIENIVASQGGASNQNDEVENEIDTDYNEETDVECDYIELKNVDVNGDMKSNESDNVVKLTTNETQVSNHDAKKQIDKQSIDDITLEMESNNAVDDENSGSCFKLPECDKDDKVNNELSSPETKGPKNKRKSVQPRKVMKHDGKNKFKNKSLFKPKKSYSQPVKRVQIKQGFTLVSEEARNEDSQNDESNIEHEKTDEENHRRILKSKLFKCGLCNKTMSRYMMMRHNCKNGKIDKENDDSGKPAKRQNCEFCGFSFIKSEYAAHVRTHTGERPFICEKCGKDFARIKYLKKHLITHEEVKPFICSLCGAGFCQNKEYKQHMCSHTGARDHVCNVCDATFICKASLLTHVQNIHLGETRFECDVCLRRFFKKSSLDLHRATHFEAALSCQFCSKKFKDSTGLKRHEKIHTGVKNFRCHLCDHAFVQSTPFWSHMEKRHGLARDEAKKVHKENVAKAKILQHVLNNQEELENKPTKSEPAAKSFPVLQQPLYHNMITAGANLTDEFESMNKDYHQMDVNQDKSAEYTHHILTNVNPHVTVSQVNMSIGDNVDYSHTVDLSKYTTVPQSVHYDTIKSDFSDYVHIEDDSASDSVHKTISQVNNLPSSSQYENEMEHVNVQKYYAEGLERVQSDLRDLSRYQYDVMKHNEQYADLYDPVNYEKVHDLSNPEQKAAKVGANRFLETTEKERNGSPEEPYSGYVKVPDPSLYAWNKKTGHYEKVPEASEAHAINVAELDQYRLLEKGTEIHGLKISDLLPADKPQDLSFLGIAAYQSYITSAQGQGYFDKAFLQSQYEKVGGDYDKATDNSPYSVPPSTSQDIDQAQAELARVQSPYESVQDQSNASIQ